MQVAFNFDLAMSYFRTGTSTKPFTSIVRIRDKSHMNYIVNNGIFSFARETMRAEDEFSLEWPKSLLVVHKYGGFYGCHGDGKLYSDAAMDYNIVPLLASLTATWIRTYGTASTSFYYISYFLGDFRLLHISLSL